MNKQGFDPQYSTITELPNNTISELQLKRSYQRYMFANKNCEGGLVIELGCGGGQGLNLLRNVSDKLIGYDIDDSNIRICNETYRNDQNIQIIKENIDDIVFNDASVQTFLLFETIYYISDHDALIKKMYNALKPNGKIIICTANKNWHSFNPSPFSTKYLSSKELFELGQKHFFSVETFASFPDIENNIMDKTKNIIKRKVVQWGFMPKSMSAKLIFKKIFSGKMAIMPDKLYEEITEYIKPLKTDPFEEDIYNTAIFAIFTKND